MARGTSTLPKHLLPFPYESTLPIQRLSLTTYADRVNQILQALALRWQYKPALATGVGFAKGNVWSRAARRKQEQQQQGSQSYLQDKEDHSMDDVDDDDGDSAFVFKVELREGSENGAEVKVRWLQGRDSVLFESFCGMLKRQLDAP